MTPTIDASPLTSLDRCDRCGAQAYIRTVLPGGSELLFCNHHWQRERGPAARGRGRDSRRERPPCGRPGHCGSRRALSLHDTVAT